MKNGNSRGIVGIATLVIVIAMLATIQSASAGVSMTAMGTVKYENGTTCPYGWNAYMENLNASYGSEPWSSTTVFLPPNWDYQVDGEKETDSDYFRVWVESPDGKWYGENTVMYSAGYDPDWGVVVIHITVYPVELPTETFTKDLVEGWNLISLPLTNDTDMKVSNIIDTSLNDNYDALYKYDASTHSFVSLSSTDTMANGVGYFIHITTAGTWTYSGTAYTPMNVGLSQGLNMVGWLNCTKAISETSLSNPSNVYYIARWNATAQSYETHNPAAPDPYTPGGFNDNFFDMERGTGYFISAKEGYTTLSESC